MCNGYKTFLHNLTNKENLLLLYVCVQENYRGRTSFTLFLREQKKQQQWLWWYVFMRVSKENWQCYKES